MASIAEEKTGTVYGLRLKGESKIRYVGLTTKTLERRLYQHLQNARLGLKYPVCDWIRAKGADNISIDTLEECSVSILDEREVHWISTLKTRVYDGLGGLNVLPGGKGVRDYRCSPERVLAMSGENAWHAHFTNEQVDEIRHRYRNEDLNSVMLGEIYNVSYKTIAGIVRNEVYVDPNYQYPGRKNQRGQFLISPEEVEAVLADREKGLPWNEISDKYGYNKQRIRGACLRYVNQHSRTEDL